jgi:hypothetical protein
MLEEPIGDECVQVRMEAKVFAEGVDGHDRAGTTTCAVNGERAERRVPKGCHCKAGHNPSGSCRISRW